MIYKTCCNCRKLKPASEYWLNRTTKKKSNSLQSYCKKCKPIILKGWKKRRRDKQKLLSSQQAREYAAKFVKRLKP